MPTTVPRRPPIGLKKRANIKQMVPHGTLPSAAAPREGPVEVLKVLENLDTYRDSVQTTQPAGPAGAKHLQSRERLQQTILETEQSRTSSLLQLNHHQLHQRYQQRMAATQVRGENKSQRPASAPVTAQQRTRKQQSAVSVTTYHPPTRSKERHVPVQQVQESPEQVDNDNSDMEEAPVPLVLRQPSPPRVISVLRKSNTMPMPPHNSPDSTHSKRIWSHVSPTSPKVTSVRSSAESVVHESPDTRQQHVRPSSAPTAALSTHPTAKVHVPALQTVDTDEEAVRLNVDGVGWPALETARSCTPRVLSAAELIAQTKGTALTAVKMQVPRTGLRSRVSIKWTTGGANAAWWWRDM